ncbi:MAG: PG0541 family transporter-associated protein [Candidatus Omnitrophota bacterium]
MKMVMIAYNEAIESDVMEVLQNCALKNYTKVPGIFGKGDTSGTHSGNDIWPGRNNLLFVVCDEQQAKQMLSCVKELRKHLGKEGIKAFILPVEAIT